MKACMRFWAAHSLSRPEAEWSQLYLTLFKCDCEHAAE